MKLSPSKTLSEIASFLGADFEGASDFPVTGINEIHKVEPGDLTFVDHSKYYDKALASAATTIIINKKVACPAGKALIFSENPFQDYNKLTLHFRPFDKATEPVSATARVGEGTVLQPGVFVGNHVTIGNNCIIHANVSIYDHCVIGDNVIIHSGTVIGSDAFYMKKAVPAGRQENGSYQKWNSCGRVVIHNNVEIGANCTIDRGVSGDTVIGEGTKMDNLIQIGHDTVIGKNCLFASQVGIAGVVIIEDDVILWGQVGVQKDLTIGKGAVVLGQSGIAKSIEGNKIWFGSPVREAREKMKELALIKQLPSILEKLK